MQELVPGIYIESGYRGVTVGAIIADEGVICIDSPMLPAEARDWRARLTSLAGKPICYIVYTDVHRDRILGGQYLGGAVIAHDLAGETLNSYGDIFRQQAADWLTRYASEAALEVITHLRVILPQITFSQQLVLHGGSSPIVLQHVGGPTPGSLWVLLPGHGILFTGDIVTHNTHPNLAEADLEQWLDLLRELSGKKPPASIIVPGRGSAVARQNDIARLSSYLRAVRTRVRAMLHSNRSRADTAVLVQEFLPRFPVPNDEREHVQRRIKAGLEHIYDLYCSKT